MTILKNLNNSLSEFSKKNVNFEDFLKLIMDEYKESVSIVLKNDNKNTYLEYFAMHEAITDFLPKLYKNNVGTLDVRYYKIIQAFTKTYQSLKRVYFEKSLFMNWLDQRFCKK